MINSEVEKIIEKYLKDLRGQLPDGFETDDLIEDLRAHMIESFEEKRNKYPQYKEQTIIQMVLDELGEPEEIAREYGQEVIDSEYSEKSGRRMGRMIIRFIIAVIATVICAWILVIVTEGRFQFWTILPILLVFAIAEWIIRAWQAEIALSNGSK